MNKQELIDGHINALKGEWIFGEQESAWITDDWKITKEEFTKRARELGWINGYKWGEEYPTNGKKPDLPGDLNVIVKYEKGWRQDDDGTDTVYEWAWSSSLAFKIIDDRYKPKDVGPKGLIEAPMFRGLSEPNETPMPEQNTEQDNSWYDYDKQQAVSFAPDKTRCQVQCGESWQDGVLIASHGPSGWFLPDCGGTFFLSRERFRPLDYNRKADEEKLAFVERAAKIMAHADEDFIGDLSLDIDNVKPMAGALYNAGCRFK